MATRTIINIANLLRIPEDELLCEVKKIQNNVNLDSSLNEEVQITLLGNLIAKYTQIPDDLLRTKSKLDLIYYYEKHYLELMKEYKEEIKFASALQEDLRRERSQFFTQTLREVIQTLESQEIDKKVTSQWIEDLVSSYTESLDLSGDLAKTQVINIFNLFKETAKEEASKAKFDDIDAL